MSNKTVLAIMGILVLLAAVYVYLQLQAPGEIEPRNRTNETNFSVPVAATPNLTSQINTSTEGGFINLTVEYETGNKVSYYYVDPVVENVEFINECTRAGDSNATCILIGDLHSLYIRNEFGSESLISISLNSLNGLKAGNYRNTDPAERTETEFTIIENNRTVKYRSREMRVTITQWPEIGGKIKGTFTGILALTNGPNKTIKISGTFQVTRPEPQPPMVDPE